MPQRQPGASTHSPAPTLSCPCPAPSILLATPQQDALDLTRHDISHAGIASVCGTIFSRVAMGTMADAVGPRYSAAIALLLTAPLMFGMALMQRAAGFIALRMLVGLGLSMFVVNQKWMGEMFNRQVVGRATALSAGQHRPSAAAPSADWVEQQPMQGPRRTQRCSAANTSAHM